MTLDLNEFKKRLSDSEQEMKELTAKRETLRIRIYRYKKAIRILEDINQVNLGFGENPDINIGDC